MPGVFAPMRYVRMQHSQPTHPVPESVQPLTDNVAGNASESTGVEGRADPAEGVDTVSIELNFKAFADNVPSSQHATRAAQYSDPSIQDFADQALELATLRAEVKRLTRDYELVLQQVRVRDSRLNALLDELSSARAQLREAQRPHPPTSVPEVTPVAAENDGSSAETAEVLEPTQASLLDVTSTLEMPQAAAENPDSLPTPVAQDPAQTPQSRSQQAAVPQLIPLDQPENPIALSREILTIGRTRRNDICIPSRAISRDHARLLVARSGVTLIDVSNTNGCFVNDQPVKRHRLREGDLVRIGDRHFRFAGAPGAVR